MSVAGANPSFAAEEDHRSETDMHRHVTRKRVVEGGWGGRKDCTTVAGQTKRSVEDVTKKKARRSTDCVTARVGRRAETRFQRVMRNGATGQNIEGILKGAERNHVTPSERRSLEDKPSNNAKDGNLKSIKLGGSSRMFPESCRHGSLLGSFNQMERVCAVSVAARLRRGDGADARDGRDAGCRA